MSAGRHFVREGYGLGLGVLRVTGYTDLPVDHDARSTRTTCTSAGSSPRPRSQGESGASWPPTDFTAGVSQDIPIWENKIYKDPPVLRPSEKDVIEHRRWARQFYSVPPESPDSSHAQTEVKED